MLNECIVLFLVLGENSMFYKIRDCVDVYTLKDNILMFYFINTRKTYEYKVN